jgi:hypothetical protein
MDLERVLNVLRSVDFDRPQVLYLWLPGTLLALALLWALGLARRRIGKRRWGSRRAVERLGKGPSLTVEFLTFCALELSVALLVVAVAGPGLPNAPVPVVAKDLDIVFNFDVSRSLLDETYRSTMPPVDGKDPNDVPGSYGTDLDVLKLAVLKELPNLVGNRIGITTYSGAGWIQGYLTYDFDATSWIIQHWVYINAAPGGGSDQTEGLATVLDVFEHGKDEKRKKVLVWFSDGGLTGKDADFAKLIPKLEGVRVYVVGIGPDQPTMIPAYNAAKERTSYIQVKGQNGLTQIDEARLKQLAQEMHGEYLRYQPGTGLGIDWSSEFAGKRFVPGHRPVYEYPLAGHLITLSLLFLAIARRAKPSLKRISA